MTDNELKNTGIATAENTATAVTPVNNKPLGFEEAHNEDIMIPRLKVMQAMSQERSDGIAVEGDIINSLTLESAKGKKFIPIKVYYSNFRWNPDRTAEKAILCRSYDGRIGNDGENMLVCADCRLNQFDNSKTGRDAQPQCTTYINFLGILEDSPMPVILSFAKTSFNEGKRLLSVAKSMRKSLWAYSYIIDTKKNTKDKQSWYVLTTRMSGNTPQELQEVAYDIFKMYETAVLETTLEDTREDLTDKVDAKIAAEI